MAWGEKGYQRYDDEEVCGTAICYEVYRNYSDASKPVIIAAASDFMIVPRKATFLDQLRRKNAPRVKGVNWQKRGPRRSDNERHSAINWAGGSLDDEIFVIIGPNLSSKEVLSHLRSLVATIEKDGVKVAVDIPDVGFEFEKYRKE